MAHFQYEGMEWAEPLPSQCPPTDANPPNHEEYYRFVGTIPPREEDFYSQRRLYPNRKFRINECRARSISLFGSYEDCLMKQKLPSLKHKRIVGIALPPESGVVVRTGQASHHSWWRAKHFDAIAFCREAIGHNSNE
jgi:hypothetical protein